MFQLSQKTVIVAKDEEDKKAAQYFNDYLQNIYGLRLDVDKQESKNYIRLITRKFIKAPDKDGYSLQVTKEGVQIEGDTYTGTFYGIQTLIQLLPVENVQPKSATLKLSIPVVSIQDYPRFRYRGLHLDVSRHFFPASFIKKYIDYIALHKMNYFHWHLTEDQGWRIEIKKYPKLTSIGAWRNGTIIGRNPGTGNDNLTYGGFYTQDEVREIIKYAADRHVTVIPEIEMPGHSSAAIASYPWLSCFSEEPTVIKTHPSQESIRQQATGKAKLVQEGWGVFEDVYCAGNDSTFLFLQDVIDEVAALFPSNYIHVGGDECPKSNWKRCPKCQARMKTLGLKDEHELQSYFIQRMEKYINGKGKTIIGWDEILEGGLAPNATVMSWRGEKGGIEAANQNHQVIMTPEKPVYFDHTQTRNEDSVVIGGYNPLEAVYAYEPLPKELAAEKAKYVLGAQANVWSEYIKNPSKLEYMIFPRLSALSEVLWSPRGKKNWNSFENRLPAQFKRYDLWNVKYSKAFYDVKVTLSPAPNFKGVKITAEPKDKTGVLKYTLGNSTPALYTKPVIAASSGNVVLSYTKGGQVINQISLPLHVNKATGKNVLLSKKPNEKYAGQSGTFSLVNGVVSTKSLSQPDWMGWIGEDLEVVIDLGSKTSYDSVRLHLIHQTGSWVYLPQYIEISKSNDGKNFRVAGKASQFVTDTLNMGWITVPISASSRFIKLLAKNYGIIPEGRPGAGNKAWLIADEIQVY